MSARDIEAGVSAFEVIETDIDGDLDLGLGGKPWKGRDNADGPTVTYSSHLSVDHPTAAVTTRSYSTPNTTEFQRQESLRRNVTLSWHDLKVDLEIAQGCINRLRGVPPPEPEPILKKVSGSVSPGWLVAIMGASGSGKTTLLNALCGRTPVSMSVEGTLNINGTLVTPYDIKHISAYVQQKDVAFATLTVREHLEFQALLRMDKSLSPEERLRKVKEVIAELGLQKCVDNRIGSRVGVRGISGGELKRLSFASEVLMDPPLLFVDEPTSGLDSFMAQSVVSSLQDMARAGRTILCTIHQPPSKVFAMFNRLLLLAEGRTAYYGRREEALDYFRHMHHPCPKNFNPADHYIYTLAIVPKTENESRARVQKFTDEFTRLEANKARMEVALKKTKEVDIDIRAARKRHGEGRWTQFKLVMWRTWLTTAREPTLTRVRLMQSLVVALFVGLIFLQVQTGQSSIQNINGVIFFIVVLMSFSSSYPVVQVFPAEKHIFLRDADNNMYKTWIYLLAKSLAELPFLLINPLIFQSAVYFMIGLNPLVDRFFVLYIVLVAVSLCAQSVGYCVSAAVPTVTVGLAIEPPIVIPFILFGGFFIKSDDIPVYFIWLEYISWIKYGFEAAMVNEWRGKSISGCPSRALASGMVGVDGANSTTTMATVTRNATSGMGMPCFRTGEEMLTAYSFDEDNMVQDIFILLALGVAFRLIAYCILELNLYRRNRHTRS